MQSRSVVDAMSDLVWGEYQPSMDKQSPLYSPGGDSERQDRLLMQNRFVSLGLYSTECPRKGEKKHLKCESRSSPSCRMKQKFELGSYTLSEKQTITVRHLYHSDSLVGTVAHSLALSIRKPQVSGHRFPSHFVPWQALPGFRPKSKQVYRAGGQVEPPRFAKKVFDVDDGPMTIDHRVNINAVRAQG